MPSTNSRIGHAKPPQPGGRGVARPVSFNSGVFAALRRPPFKSSFLTRCYNFVLKRSGKRFYASTYFGARIKCDPNEFIQSRILQFGIWEPNISKLIETTLRDGDVFVDVGANIGYDTLLASTIVGAGGGVVSIEASPKTFEILSRQIHENQARNVRTVNRAVSDAPGTLTLYNGGSGDIGRATTIKSRGFDAVATVASAPLDHILTAEERSRLRLIKIDIEGAELPVLRRFLDTVDLYPATVEVIVEASPQDDPPAWSDVFARMQAAGFHPYFIENRYDYEWYLNWRQPSPPRRLEQLPSEQSDILFARRKLTDPPG
jgi:FkbM family methyltransferase